MLRFQHKRLKSQASPIASFSVIYIYPSPIESPIAYSHMTCSIYFYYHWYPWCSPCSFAQLTLRSRWPCFSRRVCWKANTWMGNKITHIIHSVFTNILYIWRGKGVLNSESCVLNLGSFVTRHVFFVSVNRRKAGTSNALHVVAREDPDFMTWDCGSRFCRQEMKSDENYEILRYSWVTP